jgi:hypothetical protein
VLRIKLADLKRQLHVLRSSCANVEVLKRELHHLGRDLLQERTKVKALAIELENPLNVHRCAGPGGGVVACGDIWCSPGRAW